MKEDSQRGRSDSFSGGGSGRSAQQSTTPTAAQKLAAVSNAGGGSSSSNAPAPAQTVDTRPWNEILVDLVEKIKLELQSLNNSGGASNLEVYHTRLENLSKLVLDGNTAIDGDKAGFGAGEHSDVSGKFFRW